MNIGHGHVFKRDDGQVARCGGPGFCPECSLDQAQLEKQTKKTVYTTELDVLAEKIFISFGADFQSKPMDAYIKAEQFLEYRECRKLSANEKKTT